MYEEIFEYLVCFRCWLVDRDWIAGKVGVVVIIIAHEEEKGGCGELVGVV